MWHIDDAAKAINALAKAKRVVLGLDLRQYAEDGTFFEYAWSIYDEPGGGNAERARQHALAALERDDLPGTWVLVTWRSPT